MKNFDGPIWFLRDMSVGPTAFRKRISSVSIRFTLTLNHSKLTYLALAGLTNTVVKGKKQYFCNLFTYSTKNIHAVLSHRGSKVKEIEILIRLRFSLFNMAAKKILRQMIIDPVTHFPRNELYNFFKQKKLIDL